MSNNNSEPTTSPETKTIAVRIPTEYHRALRKIGVEHGLDNTRVILWALDLLQRYAADGGTYAGGRR